MVGEELQGNDQYAPVSVRGDRWKELDEIRAKPFLLCVTRALIREGPLRQAGGGRDSVGRRAQLAYVFGLCVVHAPRKAVRRQEDRG